MNKDQLEALEMRHEYDTGAYSVYRYRGGTGQIDVQICVPYGCLKTEFDVRLVLTKSANASPQS